MITSISTALLRLSRIQSIPSSLLMVLSLPLKHILERWTQNFDSVHRWSTINRFPFVHGEDTICDLCTPPTEDRGSRSRRPSSRWRVVRLQDQLVSPSNCTKQEHMLQWAFQFFYSFLNECTIPQQLKNVTTVPNYKRKGNRLSCYNQGYLIALHIGKNVGPTCSYLTASIFSFLSARSWKPLWFPCWARHHRHNLRGPPTPEKVSIPPAGIAR